MATIALNPSRPNPSITLSDCPQIRLGGDVSTGSTDAHSTRVRAKWAPESRTRPDHTASTSPSKTCTPWTPSASGGRMVAVGVDVGLAVGGRAVGVRTSHVGLDVEVDVAGVRGSRVAVCVAGVRGSAVAVGVQSIDDVLVAVGVLGSAEGVGLTGVLWSLVGEISGEGKSVAVPSPGVLLGAVGV